MLLNDARGVRLRVDDLHLIAFAVYGDKAVGGSLAKFTVWFRHAFT